MNSYTSLWNQCGPASCSGDPELIALFIQLYGNFGERVFVASEDKGLLRALRLFSERVKYELIGTEFSNH